MLSPPSKSRHSRRFPAPPADPYTAHAQVIESVLARTCRTRGLAADAADEFCSWARLRLLENGQVVLGKFAGRSSLRTYLVTVVGRLFLDWRNHEWGKWRPSGEARRMGGVAVELERLVFRDHHTFEEAAQMLVGRGLAPSVDLCERVWACLPRRPRRRRVDESVLATLPCHPLAGGAHGDRERRAARILGALDQAIAALPDPDRSVLRLRYWDRLTVSRIAALTGEDPGRLYGRFRRIREDLRHRMVQAGIDAEDVSLLLGTLDRSEALREAMT